MEKKEKTHETENTVHFSTDYLPGCGAAQKPKHFTDKMLPASVCSDSALAALIILMVPEGAVFGSHTDWLSQHVTLAETIRNACPGTAYASSGLAWNWAAALTATSFLIMDFSDRIF